MQVQVHAGEATLTSTSLPGLEHAWTFSDPSSAYAEYSEPAVVGGVTYFGLRNGIVYALSVATGKVLWEYQTGGAVIATPTVSGSTLYAGSYDGNLYALDLVTGALRWKFSAGGLVSSPVIAKGDVYFTSGTEKVYAVDTQTGEMHWVHAAAATPENSESSFSGVAYSSSRVYYTAWTKVGESKVAEVIALSAGSGTPVWHSRIYETWDPCCNSDPTVANGKVYAWAMAGFASGVLAAFSAHTGERVWYDPGYWFGPGSDVAADGQLIYANFGYDNPGPCTPYAGGNCGYPQGEGMIAMHASSGAPAWVDQAPTWSSTPSVAGGLVYGAYTTTGGTLFGAAKADTGEIVWQDAEVSGRPGPIADGNLLFPDGNAIWDYQLPLVNIAPPAITGRAAVGTKLKAVGGTWSGAVRKPHYAYQWESCAEAAAENCYVIPGATEASLKVEPEQTGRYITVAVTASNEQQSGHATSPAIGPVAP